MVTNPDMLHAAILPHHTKWFQLFEQLQIIVVDELHTYRGLFGSHVANVLRRLLRICAHYGSHPVIVCCSATIGNPAELAGTLTCRADQAVYGASRRPWWIGTAPHPASATSFWSNRPFSIPPPELADRPQRSPLGGPFRSFGPPVRPSSSAALESEWS